MGGDMSDSTRIERRTSDRVRDDSTLLVGSCNLSGSCFAEVTTVNDISLGGISFWLKTQIEPGVTLDVSFWEKGRSAGEFFPKASVIVLVLRVIPKDERSLLLPSIRENSS